MTQSPGTTRQTKKVLDVQTRIRLSYYGVLDLDPTAAPMEIRRQYRHLSKKFHPDTTTLPEAEARAKFIRLNEAYATLSNPERRSLYDLKIGFSRYSVIQQATEDTTGEANYSSSAYLDPTDRPLSAGEIFALLIMVVTFGGCLLLAIALGVVRQGDGIFG
jgi:curved DNA-binding protein CbpA